MDRVQDRTGEVIDRVQDRTSDLVDQTKDTVGQLASSASDLASTAGDRASRLATTTGSTVMDTGVTMWDGIRRNPLPAALTGLGIAWMILDRKDVSVPVPPVGDLADRARDRVGDLTDRARGQIDDLSTTARFRTERGVGQVDTMMNETPLAIGAMAFGLGAALGLAIPTTNRERELMGETRGAIIEKTQQVAQEAQQRIQHVAEQVQQAASEEISTSAKDMGGHTGVGYSDVESGTDRPETSHAELPRRDYSGPETKAS
jgi:ElaB/YqjD/DUF883 family membrane-anchored ribosome-binding protein